MVIKEKDAKVIRALRERDVLQDVQGHLLDQKDGIILISCADGDRFPDIFAFHTALQSEQRSDPRVHTFAWNGGPLRLAPASPTNKLERTTQIDLMEEVRDARAMKGIDTVALVAHWPCGKAGACKISLPESIRLAFAAKERLKEENHGIRVALFLQVDYGDKMRTYFASRAKWLEFSA